MDLRFSFTCELSKRRPRMLVTEGDFLGPDRVQLGIRLQFVKPGKGTAFLRGESVLRLETKVRSDVVARWALAKLSNAGALKGQQDFPTGEAEFAQLITSATKDLPAGDRWDPDDDSGEAGAGVPLRRGPAPPGSASAKPKT